MISIKCTRPSSERRTCKSVIGHVPKCPLPITKTLGMVFCGDQFVDVSLASPSLSFRGDLLWTERIGAQNPLVRLTLWSAGGKAGDRTGPDLVGFKKANRVVVFPWVPVFFGCECVFFFFIKGIHDCWILCLFAEGTQANACWLPIIVVLNEPLSWLPGPKRGGQSLRTPKRQVP